MRRRRHNSAFTLLELILVMVLIALIVAIVAPRMTGFSMGQSNSETARRIVAAAQYAQAEASNEGRTYRLNFDPPNGKYWLTMQNGAVYVAPGDVDYKNQFVIGDGVASMNVDIQPQPDGLYVQFRPTGRSDPINITLTDRSGQKIVVACQSPTEAMRILKPEEMR